jgi:hypothetical protein
VIADAVAKPPQCVPTAGRCVACHRPAAAVVGARATPMDADEVRLNCRSCLDAINSALDEHVATISAEDLADVEDLETELTSEESCADALACGCPKLCSGHAAC